MSGVPTNLVQANGSYVITDDYLNTLVQTDQTAAQLRLFVGKTGMAMLLQGIVSQGDGSGGLFYWSWGSGYEDDNLNVIVPPEAAGQGAWLRGGLLSQTDLVNITGGTINNTTIGATTPSTGAFTTLSASSTVSGAGFTAWAASPPPIGDVTPSTGAFTTLSATGATILGGGTTPAPVLVESWYQPQGGVLTPLMQVGGIALGTVTSGQAFYNSTYCSADSLDTTTGGSAPGGSALQYFGHNITSGATGGRTAVGINLSQSAATTLGLNSYYVGMGLFSTANYSCGGSSGSLSGNLFAANSIATLSGGAGPYWNALINWEFDVSLEAGAGVGYKGGIKVVQTTLDAVQGTFADYGLSFHAQAGGAPPGWQRGIAFGSPEGWWNIHPTGTMVGTYTTALGGGPSMSAAFGVDLSGVTFSSAAFKSNGFSVSGAGAVTSGTASWSSGTGAPGSGTPGYAVGGSMFSRTDGSTGSRLYVSTGSAWNAVAGV